MPQHSEEGIAAQTKIGTLTGFQKSITPGILEFIAKQAHIGRVPLSQMAETYGQVWAMNKKASPEEIQNLFLQANAIGQSGSFSISNFRRHID